MNFSILWSVIVAIEITNEMEELVNGALSDGFPCVLGTASLNGDPNLSFKGSMMVISSNELAFWERARKGGFAQLISNPKVDAPSLLVNLPSSISVLSKVLFASRNCCTFSELAI